MCIRDRSTQSTWGKFVIKYSEINPTELGFEGKASDLYYLVPNLREMYIPSEALNIQCMHDQSDYNKNFVIKLLNQDDYYSKNKFFVMYPFSCNFKIKGENALSISIFLKFLFRKKAYNTHHPWLECESILEKSELYFYSIEFSKSAVNSYAINDLSMKLANSIEKHYHEYIYPYSISIPQLFNHSYNYKEEYKSFDQVCFTY
eukprot:TRINITY_DN23697_c0_g1_i4.p1 TRINITY_DN23697_c0_g1~~TRINITY_DN23697_c0_g1_i4.p1  ORF type:complete len:203 (-),score=29.87 TRINITY_DN23697_c0_g1_i4:176-784(-)